MRLVDSHCHFDDDSFDADRGAALARARAAGVEAIVLPAISAATWPRLRALAARDAIYHASYGLHPMYMAEHKACDLDALPQWLESGQAVAVGECGLDFYIDDPDPDAQRDFFDAQLGIARELDLPVIVHARRAVDEVTRLARRHPGIRGVIHSFSGSEQQARQLIDLGFCLGFGGPITYPRANRLRGLVASLPLDALLLETDAPDQPDADHRGERNEPALLPRIAEEIAALRGISAREVAETTTRNAAKLFNLPL